MKVDKSDLALLVQSTIDDCKKIKKLDKEIETILLQNDLCTEELSLALRGERAEMDEDIRDRQARLREIEQNG